MAREVPTVVDEFLDVIGIEPQRASTRSHFHSRKIGLAFSRCMLNHPGDAHSQFLSDIPRPHELPNRPEFNGSAAAVPYTSTPLTRGIRCSFESTLGMIPIYGMNGTGSKSHRRRMIEWVRNEMALFSGVNNGLEPTQAYFESLCSGAFLPPVICASSAVTATRRLSGIVFA